jgi:hypothetical protein
MWCCGARTGSHCVLIAAPAHAHPIIVSDAAVNIAPDLDQKRDIVQNAITPCQLWGFRAEISEDGELPNSNRSIWRKQVSFAAAAACALSSQKRDR